MLEKRPFWKGRGLNAVALAVVVALALGFFFNRDTVESSATLLSSAREPALRILAHSDYLQVQPLALPAPAPGSSLELWVSTNEGKPISLGLIPESGEGIIGLNNRQQQLLGPTRILIVTLGPQGGSPTGEPAGPVLYQGALAQR